jgi:hypothetical protein
MASVVPAHLDETAGEIVPDKAALHNTGGSNRNPEPFPGHTLLEVVNEDEPFKAFMK